MISPCDGGIGESMPDSLSWVPVAPPTLPEWPCSRPSSHLSAHWVSGGLGTRRCSVREGPGRGAPAPRCPARPHGAWPPPTPTLGLGRSVDSGPLRLTCFVLCHCRPIGRPLFLSVGWAGGVHAAVGPGRVLGSLRRTWGL